LERRAVYPGERRFTFARVMVITFLELNGIPYYPRFPQRQDSRDTEV
jgi:hypothetical protein